MKETQKPQEKQDVELVKVNDRYFTKDSLDDESLAAFNQSVQIQQKIQDRQIDIRDLNYALNFVINFILERSDKFNEVTEQINAANTVKSEEPVTEEAEANE